MSELFKFRCYHCQKLIGAPPSKLGRVVKCPKCGVDLIVPSPEEQDPPLEDAELEAFHPEALGLRLDPEPISRPSPPPRGSSVPVGPDPIAFLNQGAESVASTGGEATSAEAEAEPEQEVPVDSEAGPLVARRRRRRPSSAGGEPSGRSRDVAVPRTALLAWAIFALLGLAFAFAAGVLLGQRLGQ